jgi:hypothetical protein
MKIRFKQKIWKRCMLLILRKKLLKGNLVKIKNQTDNLLSSFQLFQQNRLHLRNSLINKELRSICFWVCHLKWKLFNFFHSQFFFSSWVELSSEWVCSWNTIIKFCFESNNAILLNKKKRAKKEKWEYNKDYNIK